MSSFKIFDIAASGMAAESLRLNTVASNLANAGLGWVRAFAHQEVVRRLRIARHLVVLGVVVAVLKLLARQRCGFGRYIRT
jgi:flagellar basal body rod protein FlgC